MRVAGVLQGRLNTLGLVDNFKKLFAYSNLDGFPIEICP